MVETWGIGMASQAVCTASGSWLTRRAIFVSAGALHTESLANRRELGDRLGLARALEELATVAAALVNSLRAAHIWGAAERLREEIGTPLSPTDPPRYDQRVEAARAAAADDASFDRAWQEGRALTLEEAIELASEETAERP